MGKANSTMATQSQNPGSEDNGEDMWGDLDDSDFASLDLACVAGGRDEAPQKEENIWDLLSDALEQSKVSSQIGKVTVLF